MNKPKILVITGGVILLILLAIYSTTGSSKSNNTLNNSNDSPETSIDKPSKPKDDSLYYTLSKNEDFQKGGKYEATFGGKYADHFLVTDNPKNKSNWNQKLTWFNQMINYKQLSDNSFFLEAKENTKKLEVIQQICNARYLEDPELSDKDEKRWDEVWQLCGTYFKRPQYISETLDSYFVGINENLQEGGIWNQKIGEVYKDHLISPAYVNDVYWRIKNKKFETLDIDKKYKYFTAQQSIGTSHKEACSNSYALDKPGEISTNDIPSEEELLYFCTLSGQKRKIP